MEQLLSHFIQLEHEARHAKMVPEFAFIVCNNSKQIIDYHQAIFWYRDGDRYKIQAISGTAQLNSHAPFVVWLSKASKYLSQAKDSDQLKTIKAQSLPNYLAND